MESYVPLRDLSLGLDHMSRMEQTAERLFVGKKT